MVEQLSDPEVENLAALGYRFAQISHVSKMVSKSMRIEHATIERYLERTKKYPTAENLIEAGVHVASFLLRPNIQGRGFDVPIPAMKQNQLPAVSLPYTTLAEWQTDMLQRFDSCRVVEILQNLLIGDGWTDVERDFPWHLFRTTSRLSGQVGDA